MQKNGLISLDDIFLEVEPTWPIVILANYRTGSTPLCSAIGDKFKVPHFNEPWSPVVQNNDNNWEHVKGLNKSFYNMLQSGNDRYVVKFMPNQVNINNPYEKLLNSDCFKIKLDRQDLLGQITSYYMAGTSRKWHWYDTDVKEDYTLPVDYNLIAQAIDRITHNKFLLNSLSVKYDVNITYESLEFLANGGEILFHRPVNYPAIRSAIKHILKL